MGNENVCFLESMRPIPKDLLRDMLSDPFYEKCCVSGKTPVQLHHHILFGGRQLNEKFAIVPLHKSIHDRVDKESGLNNYVSWIVLNRATEDEITTISKVKNYISLRNHLNDIFGEYKPI